MTSAKVIIAHPSTLRLCKQVGATIGGKVPLICFDEQQPDVLSYGSLLENRQAQPAPLDLDPRTSLCTLPFSSGTTGIPKGTMLTHFNLVANILQSLPIEGSFNRPGMAVLAPLPFFHIYGLNTCINVTLITGATLITMPKFDMEQYLAIIQKYRVERSIVVPPIVLGLAKHPLVDKYDLSSLKVSKTYVRHERQRSIPCVFVFVFVLQCLMSGAAPLGVEVQAECADRLKVIVKQGWGMTELSPVGAASPDDLVLVCIYLESLLLMCLQQVPGAAGILVPDTIARIADPETGEVLEPREIGELQVKGGCTFHPPHLRASQSVELLC
jgi:acyl-CoA synthetase (AMP-forming)/AMP-acid ligase II